MKKLATLVILLLATWSIALAASKTTDKMPDFNYPKTVSATALDDLEKALKSGDGALTVNALVRYSMAQSMISSDNAATILAKVDSIAATESRADYRTLLRLLEVDIYNDYRNMSWEASDRDYIEGELPSDISEWSSKHFNLKINSLLEQCLPDTAALAACPVTSYPSVITCNEAGAQFVPTLCDFLLRKCYQLATHQGVGEILAAKQRWLGHCIGHSPANLFARYITGEEQDAIYKDYRDSEWCGLVLKDFNNVERYADMVDYLTRFPNGYYAPDIANCKAQAEVERVVLRTCELVHSGDSITATLNVENAHEVTVKLYRVKDSALQKRASSNRYYQRYDDSELTLVATRKVQVSGKVPFTASEVTVKFAPQPYGKYVLRPSTAKTEEQNSYESLTVTDLRPFTVSYNNGKTDLFVVDSNTGAPVQGVAVQARKSVEVQETNAQGCVAIAKTATYSLTKGEDKYYSTVGSTRTRNTSDRTSVQVFTDLGIYRPGETVKFAVIAYTASADSRQVVAGQELTCRLFDPNGKPTTDTVRVVTDAYGRATGAFAVPTDRMNGTWHISVSSGKTTTTSHSIEVSEYKAPTFSVEFTGTKTSYATGQPVTLSGTALTYSGMPVANAQVNLSLSVSHVFWWWRGSSNGEFMTDAVAVTDAQGHFSLTLPAELFKENSAETGHRRWNRYTLTASVTTDAGETQQGTCSFTIGQQRGFQFIVTDFDANKIKPVKLPVTYASNDASETRVTASYTLTTLQGQHVHSGTFSSDNTTVDLGKVPSGQYTIEVHAPGDSSVTPDSAIITLYSPTDKVVPVANQSLWLPNTGYSVSDDNVAHVLIGTSVPTAHIYYVARSRTAVVAQGWLTYKPGMHELKVTMPDVPDAWVNLELMSTYGGTTSHKEFSLTSQVKAQKLQIKLTSFRNKLLPGDREHWSLRLVDAQGKPVQGAVVLEMFDKALNALAENEWDFSPSYSWNDVCDLTYTRNDIFATGCQSSFKWQSGNDVELPALYTYDRSFFEPVRPRIMYAKTALMSAAPVAAQESANGLYDTAGSADIAEDKVEAVVVTRSPKDTDMGNITLRQADVKTALWRPMLTTDSQGNVALEFDAPEFNTTWIVQAIGYTTGVVAGKISQEVVTQKPLMVKASLPRFVRSGDLATLSATVQNATDSALAAHARIEIFNPNTGELYATRDFPLSLTALGTQAVSVQWQVPDTVSFVGFTVKAIADGNSDGEQQLLPVLPAAQPIVETNPFYIDAAQPCFSLALPQAGPDSRVTLEYCDNPVWYCALALPTIYQSNYNVATILAHSLYAQELAQMIGKQNPQIAQAVAYWKQNEQDSVLVSALEKNADLKIGTLQASPFATDAERDTQRMQRLDWLFDDEKMAQEHAKIVKGLQGLQNSDGGFAWFRYPSCHSSLWTTSTVLEIIGELKHLGCLQGDNDIDAMATKALKYYDKEQLRLFQLQTKRDKNNYTGFSGYAYVRSLFPGEPLPAGNRSMLSKVLKSMDTEWRDQSLGEKAFYAMALWRNDHKTTTRNIIASLREYAITKPELGTYWDNLQQGWYSTDKVGVTSTILQALNEIDPQQQEIDQVRKWMLLMKQSNDWGSSSLAADAVYSLLSTGSKWLEQADTAAITIAGEPLPVGKTDKYLGYLRKTIAPEGGQLAISRSGKSPAWGAVYVQTVQPMTAVKARSITELSISKEYYVQAPNGTLRRTDTLAVGDKVQVHLVIKCNRDIDYVTVADERAACLEPVDQTSGYRSDDGLWLYHETKDAETNLFFNSLPKGTHVVSYDAHVTSSGTYAAGVATVQSQYAPQLTAHTAGALLTVK